MAEARMEPVGRVTGFFSKASVAVVDLSGALAVGDQIYIKGHTTDLQQAVDSLQVDHQAVTQGSPGQTVGLKVAGRCRPHDLIYRLAA
ncbi:MAG TPA: translation elongation factor-like protein [bacterium]